MEYTIIHASGKAINVESELPIQSIIKHMGENDVIFVAFKIKEKDVFIGIDCLKNAIIFEKTKDKEFELWSISDEGQIN